MQDESKHRGFQGIHHSNKTAFSIAFFAAFSAFFPHFPAFFANPGDRIPPPPRRPACSTWVTVRSQSVALQLLSITIQNRLDCARPVTSNLLLGPLRLMTPTRVQSGWHSSAQASRGDPDGPAGSRSLQTVPQSACRALCPGTSQILGRVCDKRIDVPRPNLRWGHKRHDPPPPPTGNQIPRPCAKTPSHRPPPLRATGSQSAAQGGFARSVGSVPPKQGTPCPRTAVPRTRPLPPKRQNAWGCCAALMGNTG